MKLHPTFITQTTQDHSSSLSSQRCGAPSGFSGHSERSNRVHPSGRWNTVLFLQNLRVGNSTSISSYTFQRLSNLTVWKFFLFSYLNPLRCVLSLLPPVWSLVEMAIILQGSTSSHEALFKFCQPETTWFLFITALQSSFLRTYPFRPHFLPPTLYPLHIFFKNHIF